MIHPQTDHVRFHHQMVQQRLFSPCNVCIGQIAMASKTILSTVVDIEFVSMICMFIVGWSNDPSDRILISYSTQSSMNMFLPCNGDTTSIIYLVVVIRDRLDSVIEAPLPSVAIERDTFSVNNLLDGLLGGSSTNLNNDPVVQSLSSGNPNTVSQVLTSVSGAVNGMNEENIQQAVESNRLLFCHFISDLTRVSRWNTSDNHLSFIVICIAFNISNR